MTQQGTLFRSLEFIAGFVVAGPGAHCVSLPSNHFVCEVVREALGVLLSMILSLGQTWLFCAFGRHLLCECAMHFSGPFWHLVFTVSGAM